MAGAAYTSLCLASLQRWADLWPQNRPERHRRPFYDTWPAAAATLEEQSDLVAR